MTSGDVEERDRARGLARLDQGSPAGVAEQGPPACLLEAGHLERKQPRVEEGAVTAKAALGQSSTRSRRDAAHRAGGSPGRVNVTGVNEGTAGGDGGVMSGVGQESDEGGVVQTTETDDGADASSCL